MLNIVILISSLAVGVKRLHDRNKSGWYLVLFYIVPGILLVAGIAVGTIMEDSIMIAGVLGLVGIRHRRLGFRRDGLPARHHRPQPVWPRSA